MNYQVFISHSTRNADVASAMKSFLDSQGIRCWKAPEDIPAGTEWSTGIIRGLKECSVIVLIFSKDADDSTNVKKEIALADNYKKVIVPFRIEDRLPDDEKLGYFLCMPQWLDAFNSMESAFNQLASRLRVLLPALETVEELEAETDTQVEESIDDVEETGDADCSEVDNDAEQGTEDSLIITDPAVIIRISATYDPSMSPSELQQAALGDWSISLDKARKVRFAYVANKGKVLAVYAITGCHETNSVNKLGKKRIRFEGTNCAIRTEDVGRSIRHYFPKGRGAANPVKYLNIDAPQAREQSVLNQAKPKDTTKYQFEGKTLGKGRLVLEVVRRHCQNNPTITFAELEKAFPKDCQGSAGVFTQSDEANQIFAETGRKRHFIDPDEIVSIADSQIAVSSQWGAGNIGKFIQQARSLGHEISSTL